MKCCIHMALGLPHARCARIKCIYQARKGSCRLLVVVAAFLSRPSAVCRRPGPAEVCCVPHSFGKKSWALAAPLDHHSCCSSRRFFSARRVSRVLAGIIKLVFSRVPIPRLLMERKTSNLVLTHAVEWRLFFVPLFCWQTQAMLLGRTAKQ